MSCLKIADACSRLKIGLIGKFYPPISYITPLRSVCRTQKGQINAILHLHTLRTWPTKYNEAYTLFTVQEQKTVNLRTNQRNFKEK